VRDLCKGTQVNWKFVPVVLSLWFLPPATMYAQERSGNDESTSPTIGVEVDVLPYVTGDGTRLLGLATISFVPDWSHPK